MYTADRRVLELMDKVTDLANAISVGRSERVWHELEMLAVFHHCARLHAAVRLLLAEGFAPEAMPLDRPLFINSLGLEELAAADETRRGSLMVGWVLAGLQDLENYFRDRQSRGHDVSAETEQLAERRREVLAYASRNGFGTRQWQPDDDPKRLADTHGRGEQYGALLVTHMFVHGTWAATSEHYLITDEGVVVGASTPTPKRWERDAGLFASHSMLLAMRAACRIFGWVEPLLARFLLSQADVPTRQAYVVAVVDPSERTAAAAYTNTARYLTRPLAPLLAGAALRGSVGAPFLIAGALKSLYDVGLYALFRRVPLSDA